MPYLIQGTIVRLKTPRTDPQGNNPKLGRMYVVITTNEDIKAGADLMLVGITGEMGKSPSDEVSLAWAKPPAHCHTDLTKPSVALCTWTETAKQTEVEITRGVVWPPALVQILEKIG